MMLHFINSCDKNCMFRQFFLHVNATGGVEFRIDSKEFISEVSGLWSYNHIVKLPHKHDLEKKRVHV